MQKNAITVRVDKDIYLRVLSSSVKRKRSLSYICNDIITKFFSKDNGEKILERDDKFKSQLIYEINRYGNNLNQIAYKLNIALKYDSVTASDKIEIKQAIESLNQITSGADKLIDLVAKRL